MKVIGLMSGTSADGVDAALVEIEGKGTETLVKLLGFSLLPYPGDLRRAILDLCDPEKGKVDKICRMNVVLGEWFAQGALRVCQDAGVDIEDVDLIGSHGQTIHHLPETVTLFETPVRGTLQIGDSSVVAERTGITTVSDFRSRDMAAGGEGAPVVPLVDYLLFRSETIGRVMLNIGGISNLTVLRKGCRREDVYAFDTGPGNMVIDGVVSALTGGQDGYDEGGKRAALGKGSPELLDSLMQHPFLALPPPKSTGREMFGTPVIDRVLERGLPENDLIRTVTNFTVESIACALDRFVFPQCEIQEIVVSGGGAENPVIMAGLGETLLEQEVVRIEDRGLPSEAKEAIAFAILANETLAGQAGNVPRATGAAHPVVLGVVTPGRGCRISVDSKVKIW